MKNLAEEQTKPAYQFPPYVFLSDLNITSNQTLVVNIKKILMNGIPLPGIDYQNPLEALISPNESDQFIFKVLIFDQDDMYYKLQAFGEFSPRVSMEDINKENSMQELYPIDHEISLPYETHIPVTSLQVYVHHPYYDTIWSKQLHELLEEFFNVSKELKIAQINDVSNDPDGFNLEIEILTYQLNDYLIEIVSERLGRIRNHIQSGAINILIKEQISQPIGYTISPNCAKIQIRRNEDIWICGNQMLIEIYISINFAKKDEKSIAEAYLESLSKGINKIILPSVINIEFTRSLSTIIEEYNSENYKVPTDNMGYFKLLIKRSNTEELKGLDINMTSLELSNGVSGFRTYLEKVILHNRIYLKRLNKKKII